MRWGLSLESVGTLAGIGTPAIRGWLSPYRMVRTARRRKSLQKLASCPKRGNSEQNQQIYAIAHGLEYRIDLAMKKNFTREKTASMVGAEPKKELLDEVVKRIVEVAQPLRIILFGSAAKGRMGPDSDLDIIVVVRDGVHRRRTAQAIYRSLSGLGVPKDIVVVTEGDIEAYANNPSLVIYQALREGKELYRAVS